MRKLAILLPLLMTMGAAPVSAAQGILDGLTFKGETGPKGKAADEKDEITFANGTFHSSGCDAYGFGSAAYTAVRSGDAIRFSATTTSKTHGRIVWQGTVRNGALEGTFTWKKLLFSRDYWVKATQK